MHSAMAQDAMTITVVVAGLFFSLSCGLLLEELLFGAVFRIFFGASQKAPRQK